MARTQTGVRALLCLCKNSALNFIYLFYIFCEMQKESTHSFTVTCTLGLILRVQEDHFDCQGVIPRPKWVNL